MLVDQKKNYAWLLTFYENCDPDGVHKNLTKSQTLLAMTHSKQILLAMGNKNPIKPADYGKFMVLSLGTGSAKVEEKFDTVESSKWGLLG